MNLLDVGYDRSMSNQPESDLNEVIARLRAELKQLRNREEHIIQVLSSDQEFHGLSVLGGIKAILKRLHEEQGKVRDLEDELRKVTLRR